MMAINNIADAIHYLCGRGAITEDVSNGNVTLAVPAESAERLRGWVNAHRREFPPTAKVCVMEAETDLEEGWILVNSIGWDRVWRHIMIDRRSEKKICAHCFKEAPHPDDEACRNCMCTRFVSPPKPSDDEAPQ